MTTKPPTRFLATLLAMVAAEAALLVAGAERLAAPDLDDPASWPTWLLTRPPDVAVMALFRWVALVAGAYLLVVTAVGGLARTMGSARLVRATDHVTPRSMRLFLDRLTGMAAVAVVVGGLTGATASTGVAGADPGGGPPTTRHGPPITLRGQAGPRASPLPTTTTTVWLPAPAPVVDEPVTPPTPGSYVSEGRSPEAARPSAPYGTPWKPDRPPSPSPSPPPPPPAPPPPSPPDPGVQAGTAPPSSPERATSAEGTEVPAPDRPDADVHAGEADTWTVGPGDHFWSIAQRVLAERWGRRPTTVETDGYWRALVAANRSRLADRDNPDLLFPGQVLTLPPVPERPAA